VSSLFDWAQQAGKRSWESTLIMLYVQMFVCVQIMNTASVSSEAALNSSLKL
jgi:hypothetical protein